eukprot:1830052-Amphidinium_carterae.1
MTSSNIIKGKKGEGKGDGKGGKNGKDGKNSPSKDGKPLSSGPPQGGTSAGGGKKPDGGKPADSSTKMSDGKREQETKNFKEHQCFLFVHGRCKRGADCRYGHLLGEDGKPQPVAQEMLEMFEKRNKDRQAKGKTRASMITADASVSIAHVQSSTYIDDIFCLYDTGANCMVLPNDQNFKGSPIKCTLPGETVVTGQVIQVLSMGDNDTKVKVIALSGAAPIMPMAILVDMAGWKIEATQSVPALLVATDLKGKRRPLNRVDNLHYLCHEDFMACLKDVYKRVDVLGQELALKKYVGSLRSKETGHLGSLAEAEEPSSCGTLADEGRRTEVDLTGTGMRANSTRVPRELEEFERGSARSF